MSIPPIVIAAPLYQPETPATPPPRGWPLLRLGFRPFYLAGALWACLSVPLWLAVFFGHVTLPLSLTAVVPPLLWHGHEMLFGFAATVVLGFLLTAVRAWTGLNTARGPVLGALALLWLAARLAAFVAPYTLYAVLDVVLLPAVALVLLRVLLKAGNRKNLPLIALLGLMTLANGVFHLSVLGLLDISALSALHAELALIVLIVCVIAGRVVPMFTRNVTPGLVIVTSRRLELALLACTALALLLWISRAPAALASLASGLAAVLHTVRLWRWHPWVTRRRPILWILHVSYFWLPLGFALLALAQWGWVAPTLAIHAFAVGVMGGLIIGMMTRTARGHTGRPLQASRAEVLAYGLILAAAAVRVLLPWLWPQWTLYALQGAALLWAAAFAIYVLVYTPWLLRTRVDGKDG